MSWLWSNFDLVLSLTLRHAALSVLPIVLGFVLSIPVGWFAWRFAAARSGLRVISRGTLVVSGLLYTIPSLPLFVAMPTFTGRPILDPVNVLVALSIYGVALMASVAADAFASVDADIRQSAVAMGYGPWRRFLRVELPLAGPVLLAGLRVVSVSTVSLLTIGQLIGVTTLGYLFTNGFQRRIEESVLTGIVAVVVIALVFDVVLVLLGRLVMPWQRAVAGRTGRRARRLAAKEPAA